MFFQVIIQNGLCSGLDSVAAAIGDPGGGYFSGYQVCKLRVGYQDV